MVARNYFYHSFIHEKQKLRMSSGIYAEVGQEEVRTADSKSLSLFFFFLVGDKVSRQGEGWGDWMQEERRQGASVLLRTDLESAGRHSAKMTNSCHNKKIIWIFYLGGGSWFKYLNVLLKYFLTFSNICRVAVSTYINAFHVHNSNWIQSSINLKGNP